MPQMDGLEFSAQAKKIAPDAQIVILSGHDNFSYAQAALRLGASDYLLKPIKKKDFEKMLNHARQQLIEYNSRKAQKQQLAETTKLNYSILRNRFFEKLLQRGTLEEHELSHIIGEIALVEEFYTDEYLYLFVYDFKNVVFAEDELHQKVLAYPDF